MNDTTHAEALHDLESILGAAAERKPVDPAVAARVQKRSEAIRNRLPETNIAVDLVRDFRDQ